MITSAIQTTTASREIQRIWLTLKLTFGIVPIVAGADKFTNILVDWRQYLNADLVNMLPVSATTFMAIVGVIEIAAGIIVLTKTEAGAYVVAVWLVCIALSLIASGSFLDVAVRDIVMAVGAFVLARLTRIMHDNNG
jgi:hypothetical protein